MTDYLGNLFPGFTHEKMATALGGEGRIGIGKAFADIAIFAKWFWNLVIAAVIHIPALINGIISFFGALYVMLPYALNGISSWISRFNSSVQVLLRNNSVQNSVNEVSSNIDQIVNHTPESSSLWDWVLYVLNADVFISTIQALASLLFIWIQVCVVICLLVTALIASGLVVYGTRKVVKLLSAGFVDV